MKEGTMTDHDDAGTAPDVLREAADRIWEAGGTLNTVATPNKGKADAFSEAINELLSVANELRRAALSTASSSEGVASDHVCTEACAPYAHLKRPIP
jgi:hypothetical protein